MGFCMSLPSSDKLMPHDQMHLLKTLIFTPLRFIKVVASDQHNYANNIKMIKGVHQVTLRPNMLISLINQWTIFNGWMDGQPGGPMRGSRNFCQGVGVQARRPEYRIRTWDTHARTCTHTCIQTYRRIDIHVHV